MKLFGKEISKSVLAYDMKYTTREQDEAILTALSIDKEFKAKKRMNDEKDPETKAKMQKLIDRKVYDFDTIFGPENN